jgi:4-hydroxybenzoate polyprenyltransferase
MPLGLLADWSSSTRSELVVLGAFPFAVGAALAKEPITKTVLAALAGASLHWATVLVNNLTDRESDSLHPRKSDLAIVAGRITSRQAAIAIAVTSALFLAMLLVTAPTWAVLGIFVPLAGLQVYVNIFQKRSRWMPPLAMDFLFGVTVGSPVLAYPIALKTVISTSEVLFAVTLILDAAILNMIVGNLKDLPWDLEAGDATTAISFGVRPDPGDEKALQVTGPYLAITSALLMARTGLISASAASSGRSPAWPATLVVLSLLGVGSWVRAPQRGSLVPNTRYGYLFVATNFVTLFAAALLIDGSATMFAVIAGTVVLAPISGASVTLFQRWRPIR